MRSSISSASEGDRVIGQRNSDRSGAKADAGCAGGLPRGNVAQDGACWQRSVRRSLRPFQSDGPRIGKSGVLMGGYFWIKGECSPAAELSLEVTPPITRFLPSRYTHAKRTLYAQITHDKDTPTCVCCADSLCVGCGERLRAVPRRGFQPRCASGPLLRTSDGLAGRCSPTKCVTLNNSRKSTNML